MVRNPMLFHWYGNADIGGQLSTRQFYGSNLEFHRRNDRGHYMPLSQSPHFQDQYEPSGHLSDRTTPCSETESRGPSTPRKRVPVACERCRKRKIKCSGNDGDSGSCVNCRNAGQPEQCKFMRVASYEAATVGIRAWQQQQQQHRRYSPYSVPMRYAAVPSRYSPSNSSSYSNLPNSVDYVGYGSSTPNVEWSKSSYMSPFSPYNEEEESSPYLVQPPPYILPNTDPMTVNANSTYYPNSYGVRLPSGSTWSDNQQSTTQQASQLAGQAYAVSSQVSQSHLLSLGTTSTLPSERTLPVPTIRSTGYMAVAVPSVDTNMLPSPADRQPTCWTNETSNPIGQSPNQVESSSRRDLMNEARSESFEQQQELAYNQLQVCENMSNVPMANNIPITMPELNASPTISNAGTSSQGSSRRTFSHDSLASASESVSSTYGYTNTLAGRGMRLRSSPGHLFNGLLYCRAQPLVSRQDFVPDDCSSSSVANGDGTRCPAESARSSVTSVNNSSSEY